MNDFVALLLAACAFCLAFLLTGLGVQLALRYQLGPRFLSDGNFLQLALALGLAVAIFRRATRSA